MQARNVSDTDPLREAEARFKEESSELVFHVVQPRQDWQELMDTGTEPALALGGERRLHRG